MTKMEDNDDEEAETALDQGNTYFKIENPEITFNTTI